MQKLKVITPITEPTQWCAGMVPVLKPNGSVRICVDLTELNKAVQREIHPMSSVDESLAKLGKSRVYSKLDANSGFWQLPLDDSSKKLTTFITPFGRFYFERLPFGISSAPEIFQRTMSSILKDCDGVICHMDDILVHGVNQQQHDERLRQVLRTLRDAGVTLNNKCEFSMSSITFLGHVIDGGSLKPDLRKVEAITKFPTPTCVADLQRFNGMVNQLGKFIPHLATLNAPLRDLLCKDTAWYWGPSQEKSFSEVKSALTSAPILATYDPTLPTIIASDASTVGIGAVLLQIHEDQTRRPVGFASRSLTDAEKNYAVIEKEALAITWACEKFTDYVLGLQFTVETDHKPLVPLLTLTDLSKLPTRILRFRLRLMRYSPTVVYVHGKHNCTADALSRAPVGQPETDDLVLAMEINALQQATKAALPITDQRLQDIRAAQLADPTLRLVRQYCIDGWPQVCPKDFNPYYEHRAHFTLLDDLLVKDNRIVIPPELTDDILARIHEGHLGITKCRSRAQSTVWWPGLSTAIAEMVNKCYECQKSRPTPVEPLMPSSFPSYPWEKIATDLFELDGKTYLIVVDYYSRWPEIRKLSGLTSEHVIGALKGIFAVHGIPKCVISDNGPQYASHIFAEFSELCNFEHITSSPRYPQANGEAERAVRTVKEILAKNFDDPWEALLVYRSTPLSNGLAPCELLMGRKLKTLLPMLPSALKARTTQNQIAAAIEKEIDQRRKQEFNFNSRHRACSLSELHPGDPVWIRDQQLEGTVEIKVQPRSYVVKTDNGSIRRNRSALVPKNPPNPPVPQPVPSPANIPAFGPVNPERGKNTMTRSGRIVKPVQKLDL
jgi:hypothetical protein